MKRELITDYSFPKITIYVFVTELLADQYEDAATDVQECHSILTSLAELLVLLRYCKTHNHERP